jgi:spermidine synthase
MIARANQLEAGRIAVVGVCAGSMAASAPPAQAWTFFKIDPTVEQIARNSRFCTNLSECGPLCRVVLGDARLSLAQTRDERYDSLILDAFTFDAVPAQLLTREARRRYLSQLALEGLLVFTSPTVIWIFGTFLQRLPRMPGYLPWCSFSACRRRSGL